MRLLWWRVVEALLGNAYEVYDMELGFWEYPNGYMAVGYLLFLQEQIKGIIIIIFVFCKNK